MTNDLQRTTGNSIRFVLLCLFCLTGVSAFIPAGAHSKSASEVFDIASRSTVVILGYDGKEKASSLGSGVVMPGGSVATNCHVIEKASRLVVRYQKREYPAARLHTDWDRDTCSLSVQGLNAPAVRPGSTRRLKVGTRVYAVGAPQGLELTLSEGIVSSLREIKGGQYIQTTAPISPGSSGGGLFDEEGRLIGLTTFYLAKGQNLNFALPVEWVSELSKRYMGTAKATTKRTTSTVDWLNKALELESKKDWRELIAHCQRWTVAEPENAWVWNSLGVAYGRLGHNQRAIEYYQKALGIDPEYAEAWYNLGLTYGKSGQYQRGIEYYQKALGIDPEYADAWLGLGIAYFVSGQNQRGIECFQKVLSIDPDNALAWFCLGLVYNLTGQYQRGIECFQKALGINPEYAEAWYNLGSAYKLTGQKQRAMEVYRRLKQIDRNKAEEFFKNVMLP